MLLDWLSRVYDSALNSKPQFCQSTNKIMHTSNKGRRQDSKAQQLRWQAMASDESQLTPLPETVKILNEVTMKMMKIKMVCRGSRG